MRFAFFLSLILFSGYTFAQKTFVFPKLKVQAASIAELTPANWTVIDAANGDLNQDETEDLALIFEYNKPVDETRSYGDNQTEIIKETQKPRMLGIFFKDPSNDTHRLSIQNNDFILRSQEGGVLGDPLQRLAIHDQQLYLRFKGGSEWRWELGYTFRFENKDWFLTNAINLYYNNLSGDMTERIYNFKDREMYTTNGNLYRRDIANRKTSEVLYFSRMRTFKTFRKPWTWEIMPDVYL